MDETQVKAFLEALMHGMRGTVNELVTVRVEAAVQARNAQYEADSHRVAHEIEAVFKQNEALIGTLQTVQQDLKTSQELTAQLRARIENFEQSEQERVASNEQRYVALRTENEQSLSHNTDAIFKMVLDNTHAAIETKIEYGLRLLLDKSTEATALLVEQVSAKAVEASAEAVPIQVESALAGATQDLQAKLLLQLERPLTETVDRTVQEATQKTIAELTDSLAVKTADALKACRDDVIDNIVPARVDELIQSGQSALEQKLFASLEQPVKDAVATQAGETFTTLSEAFKSEVQSTLDEQTTTMLERAAGVALKTASTAVPDLVVAQVDAVAEAVVQRSSEILHAQVHEYLKSQLESVVAAAEQAGADSATKAAADAMPELVGKQLAELQHQVNASAIEQAVAAAGVDTAKALDGFIPLITEQLQELASQVSLRAATNLVPELVSQSLAELQTQINDAAIEKSVEQAVAAATIRTTKLLDDFIPRITEQMQELASNAGLRAATDTVPQLVDSHITEAQPQITASAVERAVAAAAVDTAKMLDDFMPLITEQVRELASQTSLRATTSVVPDLVAAQAGELTTLVVQRATEQASEAATRAAVHAGEASGRAALAGVLAQAETTAAGVAESTATAAAHVAAQVRIDDLRGELTKALDPSEAIRTGIKQAIDELGKQLEVELGDAIGAATDKHIGDELPRIELRLLAKLQAEINKIPIPKDGKNGKNASVTPPIPWEKDVKYKSGTWVAHEKGIWVSARSWTDTEPTAGNNDWDCVVPGIKSVEFVQEDERTVKFVTTLSDGTIESHKIELDIPIVRGVYSETFSYKANDIATSDGSWWLAKKPGMLARPGVNADEWKLQIKHGRDGKSAEMPNRGERYKGEWKPALYHEGDVTQHGGWRWLAMRSTREQPLRSNDSWSKMGEGA